MSWVVTWKGLVVVWGSAIAAFLIVWPMICAPGRREERAMEARDCERRRRLDALRARAAEQHPSAR